MSRVGALLKDWRLRSGLSQEAVARRLGHARPGTVQSWEKGRRTPKPKTLQKLADILEVPADERRVALEALVGVNGPHPPPRAAAPSAPRDPLVVRLEAALVAGASREAASALIDVLTMAMKRDARPKSGRKPARSA